MEVLTSENIYATMVRLYPPQNDFNKSHRDYEEARCELIVFGISTLTAFKQMMTHHRSQILAIDSGSIKHEGNHPTNPLYFLLRDKERLRLYKKAFEINFASNNTIGELYRTNFPSFDINDRIENRYWSSFVGLIRLGMELEFGMRYIRYARASDKLNALIVEVTGLG